MNERVQAFSRLAAALIMLTLVLLIAFGVIDADALTMAVTAVLAIATEIVAWWKNNNVTKNAQIAQEYFDSLNKMGDL